MDWQYAPRDSMVDLHATFPPLCRVSLCASALKNQTVRVNIRLETAFTEAKVWLGMFCG